MSDEILQNAWDKIREGQTLTSQESALIRQAEITKARKAGVIF